MRHDAWVGTLLWWSCQSPVVHSCGLLNHLDSFSGGMVKRNAKFDADSLLYFLSHLNVTSTWYTYSLNSPYHSHWLVQWSRHCSRMCIPVHCPWLPGYINIMQTVLITLKMAGFFAGQTLYILNAWFLMSFSLRNIQWSLGFSIVLKLFLGKKELGSRIRCRSSRL